MTDDDEAVADVFVQTVVLLSTKACPVRALLALGRAARSLHIRRELTAERWRRLNNQVENVKRAMREGRN